MTNNKIQLTLLLTIVLFSFSAIAEDSGGSVAGCGKNCADAYIQSQDGQQLLTCSQQCFTLRMQSAKQEAQKIAQQMQANRAAVESSITNNQGSESTPAGAESQLILKGQIPPGITE